MTASNFDLIGKVTPNYFYKVTGKVGDDYLLSIHITNFADQAWKLKDVSLASLTEVQYDFDVGEKQLYKWLQPCFASGRFKFSRSDTKDGGAHIQLIIEEGEVQLDVRIPAEGEMEALQGEKVQTANSEMAHAMYEQLKAAQASEKEKAAENSELELKISEIQTQATTGGSSKLQTPSKGASASKDQSAVASGSAAHTPASKRLREEEAAPGGPDGDSPTKETEAKREVDPSVGRARVVQGRGRGRRGKGFGRIGGS